MLWNCLIEGFRLPPRASRCDYRFTSYTGGRIYPPPPAGRVRLNTPSGARINPPPPGVFLFEMYPRPPGDTQVGTTVNPPATAWGVSVPTTAWGDTPACYHLRTSRRIRTIQTSLYSPCLSDLKTSQLIPIR